MNDTLHKTIEKRITLFRRYYAMENERPLPGLAVNTVVNSPDQAQALWNRHVGSEDK